MKYNIEVLISTMNLSTRKECQKLINKSNLTTSCLIINQTKNLEMNKSEQIEKHRVLSFTNEIGLSKSRNRAIQNAEGEICLFADNDIQYVDGYEKIIEKAFEENDADIIVFYVENKNKMRKNKKIKKGKITLFNLMKARSYEIAFRRNRIIESKVLFDINYGAGSKINRGEETIFLADCYRRGIKIVSCNEKIGYVLDEQSTWFNGYDADFLYQQGAVFKRYSKRFCELLIWQYAVRKYKLYKNNVSFFDAIRNMKKGAKKSVEEIEL